MDWSQFCEATNQTPEKIEEKFEKQKRLERMLQIF